MKVLFFTVFIFCSLMFADDAQKTRLESLTKLTKVIGTVEKYYVDDIKLEEIVNKALKGLMQELDAHSNFLNQKHFKEMKIQTNGEFGGLGITVGMRDGALTVISPIDDTPAYKAGVKAGDIILKIDEKSTLNMALDEAVGYMRGKPKTPITITVVRKGQNKPLKIDIVRDIIKLDSVYAKSIGEDILYLRVSNFDNKVTKKLTKFIKDKKSMTKGIVLDLRNNPGGLLTQAISVTDLFLDSGLIVSQKGRDSKDEEKFEASGFATISKVPMVVLINGGSASASEIVGGALQDHKRAVLVGQKTFGKGSVQVVLPLDAKNEEGIKLTIAKYYLPKGESIQAKGVIPDIVAYPGDAVKEPEVDFSIKESDLKKHLEGELEKVDDNSSKIVKVVDQKSDLNSTKKDSSAKNKNEDTKKKKVISKEELYKDNQLKTGVDILRALILTN
jgi:carboxyl-terminal processing protease